MTAVPVAGMWCPDCATSLDYVPVSAPCPGCGGLRRSATVRPVPAQARATVPPPAVTGHSHFPDGSERVETGSDGFRSVAHAGPEGGHQIFAGRPPQNEDDVLRVCETLRNALLGRGERWGPFYLRDRSDDDVDATACDDSGHRLDVQVTRVERAAWRELGRAGQADVGLSAQEMAAAIVEAAESKGKSKYPDQQRRERVLALDAVRSPGHVLGGVVEAVAVDDYTKRVRALGFRAVWLVGPTTALTYRLV